ncbi:heme peroxidase [Scheffersomyces xylosifermentans]|uniref:heme peroxidase n=1 Tax=Scheffersomyces xylosifermentans TaxID=1304137 RepID=UPI00315CF2C3
MPPNYNSEMNPKLEGDIGVLANISTTIESFAMTLFKFFSFPIMLFQVGAKVVFGILKVARIFIQRMIWYQISFLDVFGIVGFKVGSEIQSTNHGYINFGHKPVAYFDVYANTNSKPNRSLSFIRRIIFQFTELPFVQIRNSIYDAREVFYIASDEVRSMPEKSDYIFNRYLKHSPFCVLNKLNPRGEKLEYEFRGIAVGKYEGFEDYLSKKNELEFPMVHGKASNAPKMPLRAKSEKIQNDEVVLQTPYTNKFEENMNITEMQISGANFVDGVPYQACPVLPSTVSLPKVNTQRKFSPPLTTQQPFQIKSSASEGKVKYINIELPNKKKSSLRLKIVPAMVNRTSVTPNNTSANRIRASIDPEDTEYTSIVIEAIKEVFPRPGYDDGSLAPIILRLSWHCCATYDSVTGNGGSNGATMRFIPEITDEGNTGLDIARSALEPIKQRFPKISYSDLWTLAGKVAIEHMGGPEITWKAGRVDCVDDKFVPQNGRLPFADKDSHHIRTTFRRMGFNDQEAVALLGAHGLGRCHKRFSGWEGKWTPNPIVFSNDFYSVLLEQEWKLGSVPETARLQFYNGDGTLMMLNTDLELLQDPVYSYWVKVYSRDEQRYFRDFAAVFSKLLELGVERDAYGQVLPKSEFFQQ